MPADRPLLHRRCAAGGAVEIAIHQVDATPAQGEGWTAVLGAFGALNHERYSLAGQEAPETSLVPYADGVARFPSRGGHVEVPMAPFLGTVGVAPRRERRMTFSQSPEYLGDVDVPALGAGARVVLPVNVDGH